MQRGFEVARQFPHGAEFRPDLRGVVRRQFTKSVTCLDGELIKPCGVEVRVALACAFGGDRAYRQVRSASPAREKCSASASALSASRRSIAAPATACSCVRNRNATDSYVVSRTSPFLKRSLIAVVLEKLVETRQRREVEGSPPCDARSASSTARGNARPSTDA